MGTYGEAEVIDVESLDPHQRSRLLEGNRTCKRCGESKHVSQFTAHVVRQRPGKAYVGFNARCKPCTAAIARMERAQYRVPQYYDRTPERCARVRSLVLSGRAPWAIAKIIRCDLKTLRRHFAAELAAIRDAA